jgi:hypothetical protein
MREPEKLNWWNRFSPASPVYPLVLLYYLEPPAQWNRDHNGEFLERFQAARHRRPPYRDLFEAAMAAQRAPNGRTRQQPASVEELAKRLRDTIDSSPWYFLLDRGLPAAHRNPAEPVPSIFQMARHLAKYTPADARQPWCSVCRTCELPNRSRILWTEA